MVGPRDSRTFSLANFEGPLDLLLYLVQKNELDIYDIPIHEITEQYLEAIEALDAQDVDGGAEFLSMAATLLLIKSKMLLPREDQEENDEEDPDPRFEIIHQLLDYCRFKQVAQRLREREASTCGFFYRGLEPSVREVDPRLGIERLPLEELEAVFQEVMDRARDRQGGWVDEEQWRVPDKIRAFRRAFRNGAVQPLSAWFSLSRSHGELIVTFLALLELMKLGELMVTRDLDTQEIEIRSGVAEAA